MARRSSQQWPAAPLRARRPRAVLVALRCRACDTVRPQASASFWIHHALDHSTKYFQAGQLPVAGRRTRRARHCPYAGRDSQRDRRDGSRCEPGREGVRLRRHQTGEHRARQGMDARQFFERQFQLRSLAGATRFPTAQSRHCVRHAGGRPHRAHGNIFIRPAEDNKAFDGMLMDTEMLADWRRDPARARLHKMQVIVSPVKAIYCEYRLFIVKRKVVSASVYRIGGRAELSPTVEDDVLDYARAIIERWTPADSFVMDVGLTQDGLKVIEFNNINSSGFYAINVPKYVDAIQTQYG
ncbi:DUF4343 domain-containing protein [Massilia sp. CCM 8694]|uniref:DUF4343 domain-containing protein n=1 Tax=Massilia genomosp. 1 TaxID=2609280 RepID=A0ABX0MUB1_9BURK|nr:DUF4343 domain-containing protein [Massilia genomosp. 1]